MDNSKTTHQWFFSTFYLCILSVSIFVFIFSTLCNASVKSEDQITEIKQVALFYGDPLELFQENSCELTDSFLNIITDKIKRLEDADNVHIVMKLSKETEKTEGAIAVAKERVAFLKKHFQREFPKYTIFTEIKRPKPTTAKQTQVFPKEMLYDTKTQQEISNIYKEMERQSKNDDKNLLTIDSYIEKS
jgi:hypothetical protein